jgi:hypothetical protein
MSIQHVIDSAETAPALGVGPPGGPLAANGSAVIQQPVDKVGPGGARVTFKKRIQLTNAHFLSATATNSLNAQNNIVTLVAAVPGFIIIPKFCSFQWGGPGSIPAINVAQGSATIGGQSGYTPPLVTAAQNAGVGWTALGGAMAADTLVLQFGGTGAAGGFVASTPLPFTGMIGGGTITGYSILDFTAPWVTLANATAANLTNVPLNLAHQGANNAVTTGAATNRYIVDLEYELQPFAATT